MMRRRLYVRVGNQCNADCPMCGAAAGPKWSLSPEDTRHLVDEAHRARIDVIELTGGEPMLFPQLDYLATCLAATGRMQLAVITNGSVSPRRLTELSKQVPFERITFSIDHPEPCIHDEMRGLPGLFHNAEQALVAASRLGIRIRVNTVVSRHNIHSLSGFLETDLFSHVAEWHLIPVKKYRPWFVATEDMAGFESTKDRLVSKARKCGIWILNPDVFGTSEQTREDSRCGVYSREYYRSHLCYLGAHCWLVERSGDVLPCNSYEYDKREMLRLGNMKHESLKAILWRAQQIYKSGRRVDCGECDPANIRQNEEAERARRNGSNG